MDSCSQFSFKLNNNEFDSIQFPTTATKQDLKKHFKLKLLLGILKNFCEDGGDSTCPDKNSNERVVKLTKMFIAKNFLHNIGIPDYIQAMPDIHLSYTEKQLINGYVVSEIKKSFSDSIGLVRTIKEKNPEFLDSRIIPEKAIIDMEVERQLLYKELILIQQKKHKLLLCLIEARLSPKIEHNLRYILKEFELMDLKADGIYWYLTDHVMKQTPYAVEALKIIEATIDKKLKEKLQMLD